MTYNLGNWQSYVCLWSNSRTFIVWGGSTVEVFNYYSTLSFLVIFFAYSMVYVYLVFEIFYLNKHTVHVELKMNGVEEERVCLH